MMAQRAQHEVDRMQSTELHFKLDYVRSNIQLVVTVFVVVIDFDFFGGKQNDYRSERGSCKRWRRARTSTHG
jgi:hypothetical protein